MFYFLIGTIFIFIGSFQRFGAAGTIVKAAKEDADTLCMSGPYAKSRHPLYFGSFMNGIGFAFLAGPFGDLVPSTQSSFIGLIPWGLAPFVIILMPIYIKMIRVEDAFLKEKFGPIFDKYCHAVPSFFPSLTVFTRDKDWSLDPERLKENREVRNFVGIMVVYVLLFAKLLYYMITQLQNLHAS
jgi:protein-S-isoprenylcysteine O-methyltransferase Ste14